MSDPESRDHQSPYLAQLGHLTEIVQDLSDARLAIEYHTDKARHEANRGGARDPGVIREHSRKAREAGNYFGQQSAHLQMAINSALEQGLIPPYSIYVKAGCLLCPECALARYDVLPDEDTGMMSVRVMPTVVATLGQYSPQNAAGF